jgi:hypothetical protein
VFNTCDKTHKRSTKKKWTVHEYGKEEKENTVNVELGGRDSIRKPLAISDLSLHASVLSDFTDQRNIAEMTHVNSDFKEQEHSKIKQIGPWEKIKPLGQPPDEGNQKTIKNKQDDMSLGNRLESINIFLELWCQFEAAIELNMTDLTKSTGRINRKVVVTDIKKDPHNYTGNGTESKKIFHDKIITLGIMQATQKKELRVPKFEDNSTCHPPEGYRDDVSGVKNPAVSRRDSSLSSLVQNDIWFLMLGTPKEPKLIHPAP